MILGFPKIIIIKVPKPYKSKPKSTFIDISQELDSLITKLAKREFRFCSRLERENSHTRIGFLRVKSQKGESLMHIEKST